MKRFTAAERDRELLSSIETFEEPKNILLGYSILVFTGHENNTFNGFKAEDHVLCWLLFLEEYVDTFEYLLGKKYILWMLYSVLMVIA
jgi:hypothetical protein